MNDDTKRFVEACEARAAKASPGPWGVCGASSGRCQCGMVWSEPLDGAVLSGIATDEMANSFLTHDQMCDNVTFAAHARVDLPEATRIIREQAERINQLEAAAREAWQAWETACKRSASTVPDELIEPMDELWQLVK